MAAAGVSGGRWSAHPWAARALRLVVFGLPIVASVAFVQLLTSLTGVPTSSLWVFLGWWFGVSLARERRRLGALRADPAAAAAQRAARPRARLPRRGAVALPPRARDRHGREPRRHGSPDATRAASSTRRKRPRSSCSSSPHSTSTTASRAVTPSACAATRRASAGRSVSRATTSTGSTGRRCCTTSASSKVDAEILNKPGRPTRRGVGEAAAPSARRRAARRSRCAAGSASGSTRSATTTSTGTAPATRAAPRARRSRSPAGSSRSPTSTT